jgi:hypothetical protein
MYGEQADLGDGTARTDAKWPGFCHRNMTFLHEVAIELTNCNTMVFIAYLPALIDTIVL